MGTGDEYKTIGDLINGVKSHTDRLESGDLPISELGNVVDEVRELYERLVVLKYKALAGVEKPQKQENSFKGFRLNTLKSAEQEEKIEKLEEVVPVKNVQTEIPVEKASSQTSLLNPQHVNPVKKETVVPVEKEEENKVENQTNLLDEIGDDKTPPSPTVHDSIGSEEEPKSVAARFKKAPVQDLKKAIAINKRFRYINELFGGNADDYNAKIEQLNTLSNGDEGKTILSNLEETYQWDSEKSLVVEFVELVERRYIAV